MYDYHQLVISNDTCHSDEINDFGTIDVDISNNKVVNLTLYVMALVLGLPGNAIILQAYACKKRKTSTDILIMAQATVDFIACVFTPVFIFTSGFPDLATDGLCQMTAITGELTAHTTLLLTTAISIDRYVVVCHPLRRRMTVRMSISLLIICTLFATAFSLGIAVLTEPHAVICDGRRLCIITSSNSTGYLAFEMTFAALFFVSFTTTTLFYALIYAFLRKRAKIHAGLVNNELHVAAISSKNSSTESNSRIDQPETNQHSSPLEIVGCSNNASHYQESDVAGPYPIPSEPEKPLSLGLHPRHIKPDIFRASSSIATHSHQHARDANRPKLKKQKNQKNHDFGRNTTRMLLVITIFFFVTWIPKLVIPVIPHAMMHTNIHTSRILAVLFKIRVTNHIVNFFVYYFFNNRFRKDVKESFKKCQGIK